MSPDSEGFLASSSNTVGSKLTAPVFFTPVTAEILAVVSETQVIVKCSYMTSKWKFERKPQLSARRHWELQFRAPELAWAGTRADSAARALFQANNCITPLCSFLMQRKISEK